jgi:hypothetical protein
MLDLQRSNTFIPIEQRLYDRMSAEVPNYDTCIHVPDRRQLTWPITLAPENDSVGFLQYLQYPKLHPGPKRVEATALLVAIRYRSSHVEGACMLKPHDLSHGI